MLAERTTNSFKTHATPGATKVAAPPTKAPVQPMSVLFASSVVVGSTHCGLLPDGFHVGAITAADQVVPIDPLEEARR